LVALTAQKERLDFGKVWTAAHCSSARLFFGTCRLRQGPDYGTCRTRHTPDSAHAPDFGKALLRRIGLRQLLIVGTIPVDDAFVAQLTCAQLHVLVA